MKNPKDIDFNKLTFEERIRFLESQGVDWKKPPAERRNPKSNNRSKARITSHSTGPTETTKSHWKDEHPELLRLLDDLYEESQKQAESRFKPSEVRQTDFDQSLEKIIETIVLYCCRTNLNPNIFHRYVSSNYHEEICSTYASYQEFRQTVTAPQRTTMDKKSLKSALINIVKENGPIQARKVADIYLKENNDHISKQIVNQTLYPEVRSGNLMYNRVSFEYSVLNHDSRAISDSDLQGDAIIPVNKLVRIGKIANQLGRPISLLVEVLRAKGYEVNANSKVTVKQHQALLRYFDQVKKNSGDKDKKFKEKLQILSSERFRFKDVVRETNRLNTKDRLRLHVVSSLKLQGISIEESAHNPIRCHHLNTEFAVYVRKLTSAYFKNSPDVTRIQLHDCSQFESLNAQNVPVLVLGVDTEHFTYVTWPLKTIASRFNKKRNVSLYSRKSFQLRLAKSNIPVDETTLSNGDIIKGAREENLSKLLLSELNEKTKLNDELERVTKPNTSNLSKYLSRSDIEIVLSMLTQGQRLDAVNFITENDNVIAAELSFAEIYQLVDGLLIQQNFRNHI